MVAAGSRQLKGKKIFLSFAAGKFFAALRFMIVLHCIALPVSCIEPFAMWQPLSSRQIRNLRPKEIRVSNWTKSARLFFSGQIPKFWPTSLTIQKLTGPKKDAAAVCQKSFGNQFNSASVTGWNSRDSGGRGAKGIIKLRKVLRKSFL